MFSSKRSAELDIRNQEMRRFMTDVRSDYTLGKINRDERETRIKQIQSSHFDAIEFEQHALSRKIWQYALIVVVGLVFVLAFVAVLVFVVASK